jgi:hypothetical protein
MEEHPKLPQYTYDLKAMAAMKEGDEHREKGGTLLASKKSLLARKSYTLARESYRKMLDNKLKTVEQSRLRHEIIKTKKLLELEESEREPIDRYFSSNYGINNDLETFKKIITELIGPSIIIKLEEVSLIPGSFPDLIGYTKDEIWEYLEKEYDDDFSIKDVAKLYYIMNTHLKNRASLPQAQLPQAQEPTIDSEGGYKKPKSKRRKQTKAKKSKNKKTRNKRRKTRRNRRR